MLVSLSGTPRWPFHTFLLKISNTRSPLNRTFERNALAFYNLAQMSNFNLFAIPETFWSKKLFLNALEF